jgi:predicted nucleic acid-binding protein
MLSTNVTHYPIALANNLIFATHNTREFERVEGLKLEDRQE